MVGRKKKLGTREENPKKKRQRGPLYISIRERGGGGEVGLERGSFALEIKSSHCGGGENLVMERKGKGGGLRRREQGWNFPLSRKV